MYDTFGLNKGKNFSHKTCDLTESMRFNVSQILPFNAESKTFCVTNANLITGKMWI